MCKEDTFLNSSSLTNGPTVTLHCLHQHFSLSPPWNTMLSKIGKISCVCKRKRDFLAQGQRHIIQSTIRRTYVKPKKISQRDLKSMKARNSDLFAVSSKEVATTSLVIYCIYFLVIIMSDKSVCDPLEVIFKSMHKLELPA